MEEDDEGCSYSGIEDGALDLISKDVGKYKEDMEYLTATLNKNLSDIAAILGEISRSLSKDDLEEDMSSELTPLERSYILSAICSSYNLLDDFPAMTEEEEHEVYRSILAKIDFGFS